MSKEELIKKSLQKQKYGLVGNHSSVKICTWTKKSIKDEDVCYKEKFYGIRCHLCCQMTPTFTCNNRCVFCWRDTNAHTAIKMSGKIDDPKEIVNGCIEGQRKLLSGLGGYKGTNKQKLKEAAEPMHFAISLTGEPTLYPKLPELIKKLHKRKKTTFLVTNGLQTNMLKKLEKENALPTQLYVSVDAPNKTLHKKIDKSLLKDSWKKLNATLKYLKKIKNKTRTTLRFTIIKGLNMANFEQYAGIIKISEPMFVEVKAYMFVGSSQLRLAIENMPRHPEIKKFAEDICRHCDYKIIDEKKESRVVLLMKRDFKGRVMKF